ncbi:hypothetical protein [Krasilnikovia sp. MM14-A1259]|uniref:hypothetical protein n=1 Tax=Krasilnikovia sp. MM14-A1259 TaxID=3373539 RepID=UPI003814A18C
MIPLLGGEMYEWSDLDGRRAMPPARGAVLAHLVSTVRGRTLVVGPHDGDLLATIGSGHPDGRDIDVTVLVRGASDARACASRTGVTVLCGTLDAVPAAGHRALVPSAYDTVVALDGLERVGSPETTELSWADRLARVVSLLRPNGRLLLGLTNVFGLHQLTEMPTPPSDAQWAAGMEHDRSRPTGPATLYRCLRDAGLSVGPLYAAYPTVQEPTVLVPPEMLDDGDFDGVLAAALRSACAPRGAVLTDPRRLVVDALHAGHATALAPAWIVDARNGDGPSGCESGPRAYLTVGGRMRVAHWSSPGWVWADGDPVPCGRTVLDLACAAVARRDLPGLRDLLTDWQAGPGAGVPADEVVVDRTHVALGPVGEPADALRALAAHLVVSGHGEVMPLSPRLLAALAGVERTAEAQVEHPGQPSAESGGQPTAAAVRELTLAHARLASELAEVRGQHRRLAQLLAARDAEIARVRRQNMLLRATLPGRLAGLAKDVLRAGRRGVRAVERRVRA